MQLDSINYHPANCQRSDCRGQNIIMLTSLFNNQLVVLAKEFPLRKELVLLNFYITNLISLLN